MTTCLYSRPKTLPLYSNPKLYPFHRILCRIVNLSVFLQPAPTLLPRNVVMSFTRLYKTPCPPAHRSVPLVQKQAKSAQNTVLTLETISNLTAPAQEHATDDPVYRALFLFIYTFFLPAPTNKTRSWQKMIP